MIKFPVQVYHPVTPYGQIYLEDAEGNKIRYRDVAKFLNQFVWTLAKDKMPSESKDNNVMVYWARCYQNGKAWVSLCATSSLFPANADAWMEVVKPEL